MLKHKVDTIELFADTTENPPSDDLIGISEDVFNGLTDGLKNTLHDLPGIVPPTVEREKLYRHFKSKIATNSKLDRSLVSNQANKTLPFYSWFRYREGFSEPFVNYIVSHVLKRPERGVLLDPFSGAGSALFAAAAKGWYTKGIEVLPAGVYATNARFVAERVNIPKLRAAITKLLGVNFAEYYNEDYQFRHITITKGAFPHSEEVQLVGYIAYCQKHITDEDIRTLLLYAAFCVLEEISYTRKDGQYLRWDARSGRSQGKKPFNKGRIYTFCEAIESKLRQMIGDLEGAYSQRTLFEEQSSLKILSTTPEIFEGSCLEMLPLLDSNSIDAVLTSPPYANRYDYTRTYALELVYLDCSEGRVKQLRQNMLSCTVENKDKQELLLAYYQELGREIEFDIIDVTFQKQAALQEILTILNTYQAQGKLNNPGIATLVRNYFYEMCFVTYELARVLKPGGAVVMVNDNVRYAGEEVPVDLILSDMAQSFGLTVKHIWTLGRGKGNSSQQMGSHGRAELRKCVYIWEKDETMAKARDQLLIEAHQINYRLRSTFFYRKIKEYDVLAFPSMIASLFPTENLYNWDEHTDWGIGEDAFAFISNHPDLKPIQVFCHPRLLREYPQLLAYYRNISALSQKSVGYLTGVDVKKYENDHNNSHTALTTLQIFSLTRLFNEHISLVIDSSIQSFGSKELNAMLLTSTGAQIDGSWRNAIGEEAEKVVQRLLVKEAVKRGLLVALMPRMGTKIEPYDSESFEEQFGTIEKYRGIQLTNQTSILFSSEPDVTLMGKNGIPWGVIEIKGGTDPAGALERYGAAKKSFENTLKDAPDAKTILIASCLTGEVKERISSDKTITKSFNLTEVIKEKERYNDFVDLVFAILDEISD